MSYKWEVGFGRETLLIEAGKLAQQAHGAVTVRYGDTVVLVTATMSDEVREEVDFTPLLVDFEERFYAAGKIPGGFIKREGKPRVPAILSARLIDRSIRPFFPKLLYNDIQVVVTVLSVDESHPPDVISIVGASFALGLSEIPFEGPIGACRIGLIGDQFIVNPTLEELALSSLDLVVAGSEYGIAMIEAGAKEVDEEKIVAALRLGYEEILKMIAAQKDILASFGKPKREVLLPPFWDALQTFVDEEYRKTIAQIITIPEKKAREKEMNALFQKAKE